MDRDTLYIRMADLDGHPGGRLDLCAVQRRSLLAGPQRLADARLREG